MGVKDKGRVGNRGLGEEVEVGWEGRRNKERRGEEWKGPRKTVKKTRVSTVPKFQNHSSRTLTPILRLGLYLVKRVTEPKREKRGPGYPKQKERRGGSISDDGEVRVLRRH